MHPERSCLPEKGAHWRVRHRDCLQEHVHAGRVVIRIALQSHPVPSRARWRDTGVPVAFRQVGKAGGPAVEVESCTASKQEASSQGIEDPLRLQPNPALEMECVIPALGAFTPMSGVLPGCETASLRRTEPLERGPQTASRNRGMPREVIFWRSAELLPHHHCAADFPASRNRPLAQLRAHLSAQPVPQEPYKLQALCGLRPFLWMVLLVTIWGVHSTIRRRHRRDESVVLPSPS